MHWFEKLSLSSSRMYGLDPTVLNRHITTVAKCKAYEKTGTCHAEHTGAKLDNDFAEILRREGKSARVTGSDPLCLFNSVPRMNLAN